MKSPLNYSLPEKLRYLADKLEAYLLAKEQSTNPNFKNNLQFQFEHFTFIVNLWIQFFYKEETKNDSPN